MSILNGSIHADVVNEEDMPFGPLLAQTNSRAIQGCFDVAVDEQARLAYVAHHGALSVFDLSDPAQPAPLSTLEGLGKSRQIAVQRGYAYITARDDGLFIVDVRDGNHPRLVARYDTIELATGVAVNGNVCLVTNRHLGVELIDVSDPASPRFITSVLAGEAQSACFDGDYMYVGDWMNKRVHVFDISDARHPVNVSVFPVDGYADGVYARDGYCYVATGHHSARLKNRRKYYNYTYVVPQMFADGYGCGHGLEIFDVSDAYNPEYVSSVKFPPLYASGFDTWLVTVSGSYAYVSDTFNGLFVIDISRKSNPAFAGYYRLPPMTEPQPASPPSLQALSCPITGIALANGHIMAAGYKTGLHVLRFDACAPAPHRYQTYGIGLGNTNTDGVSAAFRCEGQTHTVDFCAGAAIIAAGNGGLFAVNANNPGERLHHIGDVPITHDVQVLDRYVVTAEGRHGAAVYAYSPDGGFAFIDRCRFGESGARQIVLLRERRIAVVQLSTSALGLLRIAPDGRLEALGTVNGLGLNYYRQLCRTPLQERYVGVTPLNGGLIWCEIGDEGPRKTDWVAGQQCCPIEEGAEVSGSRTIVIRKRHYILLDKPEHTVHMEAGPKIKVDGALLKGRPFVCGRMLLLLHRCSGTVEFIDISDLHRPSFVKRITVPGIPEYAVLHNGQYWIACGHAGLIVLNAD